MPVPGLRRGHHCAYNLHYHFVFVVRYRRALLRPPVEAELVRPPVEAELVRPPVEAELVRLSHEIGGRYEIEVESLGADSNHVHLLCSAHPKIAPGDIARIYR